jgi:hypothetical protein
LLVAFLIGFVFVATVLAIRSLFPAPPAPPGDAGQRQLLGERVLLNAYLACFVLAPFVGAWIAAATVRTDIWEVASLLFGGFWLFWGLVPVSLAAMRRPSTLDSFKAKVERYSGRSFRFLVWLWVLCVFLALFRASRLFLGT